MSLKHCQDQHPRQYYKENPIQNYYTEIKLHKKNFLIKLQIGTSVRRNEDPSPGSPSRRRRLCSHWSCLLDVRGRRILDNPTTVALGDVGAAAGSADQGWGRLLLLIVVVDNSNKPVALGRSAV